jgi:Putative transposase of IS4/5 family (DUF4096)
MDNLLAGTLFSLIRGVSMPVIVQRRGRLLLFVCGKHSAASRTPFRQGDKNCSPSRRNGVHFQTGILFGFTTEWCSDSDRNRVHLRPDSPTGAQWRELPEKYPPFQTCHRRFQQWVRTGKLEKALQLLARHLHERGQLNLDEAFVDATFANQSL